MLHLIIPHEVFSSQYTATIQISIQRGQLTPRPCPRCSSKSEAIVLYWHPCKVKKKLFSRISRFPRKKTAGRDSNRGPPGRRADALSIRPRRHNFFYIKWSSLVEMSEIRTFEQCKGTQPNVWNPNKIVRISDTFRTEHKLELNREAVSEIRTCSDFGRLLYSSSDVDL